MLSGYWHALRSLMMALCVLESLLLQAALWGKFFDFPCTKCTAIMRGGSLPASDEGTRIALLAQHGTAYSLAYRPLTMPTVPYEESSA